MDKRKLDAKTRASCAAVALAYKACFSTGSGEPFEECLGRFNKIADDKAWELLRGDSTRKYIFNVKELSNEGLLDIIAAAYPCKNTGRLGKDDNPSLPKLVAPLAYGLLDVEPDEKLVEVGCGNANALWYQFTFVPDAHYVGTVEEHNAFQQASELARCSGSAIEILNLNALGSSDFFDGEIEKGSVDKIISSYPMFLTSRNAGKKDDELSSESAAETYGALGLDGMPQGSFHELDWVFNEWMLQALKKDGRALSCMLGGRPLKGSRDSLHMRKRFVENGWVKAVITLPLGCIPSNPLAQPVLVSLSKVKGSSVRFVDASDLDIAASTCLEELRTRLTEDSSRSTVVATSEIAAMEYSLSPDTYLRAQGDDCVPLGELVTISRGLMFSGRKLDSLVAEEGSDVAYLKIIDIDDGLIGEPSTFLADSDEYKSSNFIEEGDVVVSKNGAPFKVAIYEGGFEQKRLIANGNLYVLKLQESSGIDPYYLAAYLSSKAGMLALASSSTGTRIPTLSLTELKKLPIPMGKSKADQARVAKQYKQSLSDLRRAKEQLAKAKRKIDCAFDVDGQ